MHGFWAHDSCDCSVCVCFCVCLCVCVYLCALMCVSDHVVDSGITAAIPHMRVCILYDCDNLWSLIYERSPVCIHIKPVHMHVTDMYTYGIVTHAYSFIAHTHTHTHTKQQTQQLHTDMQAAYTGTSATHGHADPS
jgi:hypothetical protein